MPHHVKHEYEACDCGGRLVLFTSTQSNWSKDSGSYQVDFYQCSDCSKVFHLESDGWRKYRGSLTVEQLKIVVPLTTKIVVGGLDIKELERLWENHVDNASTD